MMNLSYDIIVVGAGHAGVEAAFAASRLGAQVLLATTNTDRIAFMSCNPAIGGLAKGHIVREIEALGGQMSVVADQTCIQFKRLNKKKGPAVRGRRMQCDKDLYTKTMKHYVEQDPRIDLKDTEVKKLIIKNQTCVGIETSSGDQITAKAVVITTGTFMGAVMHVGSQKKQGGRVGDKATFGISDQLRELGFEITRLKTGTPPRIDKDSVNWEKTQIQHGDKEFEPFSILSSAQPILPQVPCYLTYTNEKTHEIVRSYLKDSPLFTGQITGKGPRYCPSLEDKVTRFEDKTRHQSFLEPEGLNTNSIYVQGLSTSLPLIAQEKFLKSIVGLENVKILRAGYAVEYDFINPLSLFHTLETKNISCLYLAGQINGSSGYEEAAGQGLLAGINAAHKILEREPVVLKRSESYIGVLVDDLVTKGTKEPYRMFSSRAEHRLALREDNAWERLFPLAESLGLLPKQRYEKIKNLLTQRKALLDKIKNFQVVPNQQTQDKLETLKTNKLLKPQKLSDILKRPEIKIQDLYLFLEEESLLKKELASGVEIQVKYEGYIKKQSEIIKSLEKMEGLSLQGLDFNLIRGLSSEDREKLKFVQPQSLGQASRISGVRSSAIQALFIYIQSKKIQKSKTLR